MYYKKYHADIEGRQVKTKTDIVLINPGDRRQVYQDLGKDFSAIEPPFWLAVIAAYLRSEGFSVKVIDSNALNISPEETAAIIMEANPVLSVVIVYGSQPSASTQNMAIAGKICRAVKENTPYKVAIGGLHPSSLPKKTLEGEGVDFVIEGEGPYTLKGLLEVLKNGKDDYSRVSGLWYFKDGAVKNNPRAPLIKNLDSLAPVAAWDLLPMEKYRAHNWHCFEDIENRMPYAAIYTSLGCPYSCVFCCINAPFGKPGIRYRSPELVVKEIELLVTRHKVKNLKIADELFILDERHYMNIVEGLLKKDFGLNIWAYARVDTVNLKNLDKMKKSGINWLALGIESANPVVRDGAVKRMKTRDIKSTVRDIQDFGIRVIGNFIFGLPDDTRESMQETLDMALEIKCEFANFYCAMAYPGSKLYDIAVKEGWKLPGEWHAFSQHSYDALPLPTKHMNAKEVLAFRDNAFHRYFENEKYLNMLEQKFGSKVKRHIQEMTKVKLKRRLLEDNA